MCGWRTGETPSPRSRKSRPSALPNRRLRGRDRHRSLSRQKRCPAQFSSWTLLAKRLFYSYFRDSIHHPLEVFLADGRSLRIRRRIHKINGVRNPIFHGKLDGVQVITESAAKRNRISLYPLQQFGIGRNRIPHIAL